MRKTLTLILFISLGLMACNKGPLKGYNKITPVFGYKVITSPQAGTKPGDGIYLVANAQVFNEDDSIVSNPDLGKGFFLQVPLRKPMPGSDLMKGFQKLGDGDSTVFIMLADTFFSKLNMNMPIPDNVKPGSYIKMYVKVLSLMDSAEYEDYLVQEEFENKALAQQRFDAYLRTAGITEGADNNGIIHMIQKPGSGKSPIFGQYVLVHYICVTMSGQEVTNTYMQGAPYEFMLGDGDMISALNLSLIKMKKGQQSRLIIPYFLGYGAKGVPNIVPPYEHLIIDLELVDFADKSFYVQQPAAN